ncbi:MAG TPA: cytochrome c [Gemmataceae bacterium]|nr:cytochrome c [Gemmataceae bacterium]
MNRRAGITFTATMLALTLWSLTAYSADDDDKKANKEAQEAVIKLMDTMDGKPGDVKAQTQAIKKKFEELKPIMWVYKPRKTGGIGMSKDGASMETELAKIGNPRSKAKFTPAKLAEVKGDLIKAGKLSKAVAEVTDLYPPKKDAAKWKGYTKEMRKAADELIKATESNDVAKVKKAANNLSASCTNCHSDFRND